VLCSCSISFLFLFLFSDFYVCFLLVCSHRCDLAAGRCRQGQPTQRGRIRHLYALCHEGSLSFLLPLLPLLSSLPLFLSPALARSDLIPLSLFRFAPAFRLCPPLFLPTSTTSPPLLPLVRLLFFLRWTR
jgi:hypothetical protein